MNQPILYHITSVTKEVDNTLLIGCQGNKLNLTFHYRGDDCGSKVQKIKHSSIITISYSLHYLKDISLDINALKNNQQQMQEICCHTQLLLHEIITTKYIGTHKKIFIGSKALELLLFLVNLKSEVFICDKCKFLTNPIEKDKIESVKSILLNNLHQPPTIAKLASQVGINQCYLKRGFKELFGMTIVEFIIDQRMQKAQLIMKASPSLTISQIAENLGYSSISNFSNTFKRVTGISPSQYIKN